MYTQYMYIVLYVCDKYSYEPLTPLFNKNTYIYIYIHLHYSVSNTSYNVLNSKIQLYTFG